MLRVTVNKSAQQASKYFFLGDYYLEGQEPESPGTWHGTAAKRLGLSGAIKEDDWKAMCFNRDPQTGEQLTLRQKENRRVAADFNFHVPKSVSVLYALTEDPRILDAFQSCVRETMTEVETEIQTRVRNSNQNFDRVTGNAVWGEFIHQTSRPVDGVPDPHLHAHCVVLNATYDNQESRWKAAQFGDLKRDAPYFEAKFHVRLSGKLSALGLDVERRGKDWELKALSRETVEKFSRRTAEIERIAKQKGITNPESKAELGGKTRKQKIKSLCPTKLKLEWWDRLDKQERKTIRSLQASIGEREFQPNREEIETAIQNAADHIFERKSAVPERKLLAESLRRSIGHGTVESVESQFVRRDFLTAHRGNQRFVTTREVLAEEQSMLDIARKGRGASRPLAPRGHKLRREWLNSDQRQAVEGILSSRDTIQLVRGAAGVGKTTMLKEVQDAIEANGRRVYAFAPTAKASRDVLRSEGFSDADTVARLLSDEKLQEKLRGNVLLLDEAGLTGSRTMNQVFQIAQKMEARVIVVGDRYQHGSVERGSALKLLEDEAGLKPISLTQIQRQEDLDYRKAVKDLSEGRVSDGFEKLNNLGWVRNCYLKTRYRRLAADYLETVKEGETALAIAPTHQEGALVTEKIRQGLKEAGMLTGKERQFQIYVNGNLTEGDRRDEAQYEKGDVLVFHQNAKGFRKGEIVKTEDLLSIPISQAHHYQVFKCRELAVSAGETLRVTKNAKTLDGKSLNNGDLVQVEGFDYDGNLLTNKGLIGQDFGFLQHGYCVTSIASQGTSVDRVFIAQSASSIGASNREQFYVSVSRGKKQATIYTDDKDDLLQAVRRSDDRLSATELLLSGRGWGELQPQPVVPTTNHIDRDRELTHER